MSIWLIQVHGEWIVDIERAFNEHGGYVDYWLAADRPRTDPQPGDRLVLWMTGSGDIAGVRALGVVEQVQERQFDRNYGKDRDKAPSLRRGVLMRFTHWFPDHQVARTVLREDPRYDGFVMFKPGQAQGKSPWPLTEGHWDAVVERLPGWAGIDYPQRPYAVGVECAFDADSSKDPFNEFRSIITNREYEWIGLEARAAESDLGTDDEYRVGDPSSGLGQVRATRLVIWEMTCAGRTAEEAAVAGLNALQIAADGDLARDNVRILSIR